MKNEYLVENFYVEENKQKFENFKIINDYEAKTEIEEEVVNPK